MKNLINKICGWIVEQGYVESGFAGEIDAGLQNAKAIHARLFEIMSIHKSILRDLYPEKDEEITKTNEKP